jgi:hypothetical protein
LLPFGNTAALQIDTDSPEKLLKLIAIKTKTRDQKMFFLGKTEKSIFFNNLLLLGSYYAEKSSRESTLIPNINPKMVTL